MKNIKVFLSVTILAAITVMLCSCDFLHRETYVQKQQDDTSKTADSSGTEQPTTSAGTESSGEEEPLPEGILTWKQYLGLSAEQKDEYIDSFATIEEFYAWKKDAQSKYVDDTPVIIVEPGEEIDLGNLK